MTEKTYRKFRIIIEGDRRRLEHFMEELSKRGYEFEGITADVGSMAVVMSKRIPQEVRPTTPAMGGWWGEDRDRTPVKKPYRGTDLDKHRKK